MQWRGWLLVVYVVLGGASYAPVAFSWEPRQALWSMAFVGVVLVALSWLVARIGRQPAQARSSWRRGVWAAGVVWFVSLGWLVGSVVYWAEQERPRSGSDAAVNLLLDAVAIDLPGSDDAWLLLALALGSLGLMVLMLIALVEAAVNRWDARRAR